MNLVSQGCENTVGGLSYSRVGSRSDTIRITLPLQELPLPYEDYWDGRGNHLKVAFHSISRYAWNQSYLPFSYLRGNLYVQLDVLVSFSRHFTSLRALSSCFISLWPCLLPYLRTFGPKAWLRISQSELFPKPPNRQGRMLARSHCRSGTAPTVVPR